MNSIFASLNAGLFGLLFFFAIFLFLIMWLIRPGAKAAAEKHAQIPLNEDRENE